MVMLLYRADGVEKDVRHAVYRTPHVLLHTVVRSSSDIEIVHCIRVVSSYGPLVQFTARLMSLSTTASFSSSIARLFIA